MDAMGGDTTSICHALTQDTLEEVAAHCSTASLLSLQQTCTAFQQLLASSKKVWFRKLAEDFGLHLKALPSHDAMFVKLVRTVYEASRKSKLRFQGALVTGGVDEDAMQYWVDNLFKPDKAPYCSNCSFNADCLALLLDGEVPRDAEYARVRGYMVRRCRYAAALIMNVQLPQQDRDPDAVMNILEDWTDSQLESFFRDLVAALNQGHALGRLLVYDIEHDRIPAEQQRIQAVEQYLRDRLKAMKRFMIKPPLRPNTILDATVLDKIADPAKCAMAGIVHELTLSRAGNLTCPVSSGVVLLGHMDYSQLRGLDPQQALLELEAATQDPVCTAFNFMSTPERVEAAAAAGHIPPIAVTDQTLAGIWHEFAPSDAQLPEQQQQQQQQGIGVRATAGAPGLPAAAAGKPGAGQSSAPAAVPGTAAAGAGWAGTAGEPSVGATAAGPSQAAAAGAAVPSSPLPTGAADTGPAAAAAAASEPQTRELHPPFAEGAAPSTSTPLRGRLVRWRPLLWFHFNQYPECIEFVRSHHSLLAATAPLYSSVTVRHRGPPSSQPGSLHLPTVRAQQAAQAALWAAQQAGQPSGSGSLPFQQQQQLPLYHTQQAGPSRGPPGPSALVGGGPPVSLAQLQQQQQQQQPLPQGLLPGGVVFGHPLHFGGGPSQQQAPPPAFLLPGQQQQQQHMAAAAQARHGSGAAGEAEYSQGSLMSHDAAGGSSSGGRGMLEVESDEEDYEDSLVDSEEEVGGGGAGGGLPGAQPPQAHGNGAEAAAAEEEAEEDVVSEEGSDDEEQHAQHVATFYQAVAAAALQAAGGSAGLGSAAAAVAEPLARPSLGVVSKRSTRGRNKLHVRLSSPAAGNVLLVKLINQENLMQLFHDQHDWPNVDMAHVGLAGKAVTLPPGVSLQL